MNDHFGKNLFRLRKEHRMTQEQLANLLGVAPQSVSRWENSQVYPDTELLPQIASLLHVSIDALLGHRAEGGSATHYVTNIKTAPITGATTCGAAATTC